MKIYGYSFRNIGPFSNVATTVNFGDKAQMNMMIGENGIGKSTTIKVLKFGLYHDLAYSGDIKVDEIANDINKNGEIIIELNSRGKDWTIITNFSPNKIKIYEGVGENRKAEPEDKGGMPETKRFIREQILDIPFYIFDNILSIDIAEFKSLLTLNAEDTRKIRDRIFGFSVFNDMSKNIKVKLNAYVEERKILDHDLDNLKAQHDNLLIEIENMKEQVKSGLKIDDLQAKLKSLKSDKEEGTKLYDTLVAELAQANNDFRWFSNKNKQAEIGRMTLEKEEISKAIKANIDEQANIDTKIQLLQEYSEVIILNKSIIEDKDKFTTKNNEYTRIRRDYDRIVLEGKDFNAQLEVINDHIKKKTTEAKWLEYKKLVKEQEDFDIWIKEYEKDNKVLVDQHNELLIEHHSLIKELKTRKAGKCPECNTIFDEGHDPNHSKHIIDLETKIKKIVDEQVKNQNKINELSKEIKTRKEKLNPSRIAVLKSELGDINDQTDFGTQYKGENAENDRLDLTEKLNKAKAELDKLKDSGTLLRGELTSLKEKVTKDSERLKELKAKYTEQPQGNVNALKELRASLVAKRNELHKSENSYDVQIQVLNSKIHADVEEPKYTENEADKKLSELPQKINESKAQLDLQDKLIFEVEKSIEIANNAANLNLQSGHIKKQAKEIADLIKEKTSKLAELKSFIERQEHLLEVIKRSKDEVLRINIPYINHMVVNVCRRIGVTQNLMFDDSFVPHIYRGNREVSLMSASLGQRKKMNFAVLIAITKFLKLRYGGLNIIFYDEMFSSIDEKGRPHMLEIIRQEIVENLGIHVWITNHFFIPNSQFDNYIIIENKNGFSSARKIETGELLNLEKYTEKQVVNA